MRYSPSSEHDELLQREFDRIQDSFRRPDVEAVFLAQLNAAPARYSDGMVVYADGTNWNPGSGEGVYCYYNATWNYLG